jgi:hypothetical protein
MVNGAGSTSQEQNLGAAPFGLTLTFGGRWRRRLVSKVLRAFRLEALIIALPNVR